MSTPLDITLTNSNIKGLGVIFLHTTSDVLKAKACSLEAKAIGPKAFKHMARAEIKIYSTSDSLT